MDSKGFIVVERTRHRMRKCLKPVPLTSRHTSLRRIVYHRLDYCQVKSETRPDPILGIAADFAIKRISRRATITSVGPLNRHRTRGRSTQAEACATASVTPSATPSPTPLLPQLLCYTFCHGLCRCYWKARLVHLRQVPVIHHANDAKRVARQTAQESRQDVWKAEFATHHHHHRAR
jgi:hypothetical protein